MTQSTREQLQYLAKFMNCHIDLGLRNTSIGRQKKDRLWEDLKNKLNSFGPPKRSTIEWKKVWSSNKYKTKKRLSENKMAKLKTGGVPRNPTPLNGMDEVIISLTSVSGLSVNTDNAVDFPPKEEDMFCDVQSSQDFEESGPERENPQIQTKVPNTTPITESNMLELFLKCQQEQSLKMDNILKVMTEIKDLAIKNFEHKLRVEKEDIELRRKEMKLKKLELILNTVSDILNE